MGGLDLQETAIASARWILILYPKPAAMRSIFLLACTASMLSAVASDSQPMEGFSRSTIQMANLKQAATTVEPFSEQTAKLYLFNGTNQVPGSNELLEYDIEAKTYQ